MSDTFDTHDAADCYERTFAAMGTVVTLRVAGGESESVQRARAEAVDRATQWFTEVEAVCTRFDASSELRRLCAESGVAVPVSALLFEALQFAVAVARASDGAFDPTIGSTMESRGFHHDYRSGDSVASHIDDAHTARYTDITLDASARTVTLARPMLLDLGAVAKGLAIDMAARELAPFADFSIDAGGDLYLGGHNGQGHDWAVGIRHPHDRDAVYETIRVSDTAVCTSGDYARRTVSGHHLVDPSAGESATAASSVTVLAPSAMIADALSTAAFVLGPERGIAFLDRHDAPGMLLTPSLERYTTAHWPND